MNRRYALLSAAALVVAAARAESATLTVCPSMCSYTTIQAAANAAVPGDVIELTAGATYNESVLLPVKSGATDITITTDADPADVPAAGVQMAPSYSAFLPKIQAVSGGSPAFRFAAGAHHWKLELLEIKPNPQGHGTLIAVGAADGTQVIPSQMPYNITIDRVLGYGDAVFGQQRAIELHARDVTVVNNYLYNINAIGRDSQVIVGWNGTGPYRIENNYLNGGTENAMFGGGDPRQRTWLTVSGTPTTTSATVAVSETGGHALIDLKIGEWISIWTASGIRHTILRTVTGTGASGTIGFDPIDVVPLTGTSNIRQDAVAADIIIRNNTFSKTASYMDGILAAPTSVGATPNEATGTLAVGTWYYRIAAVNPAGYAGLEVWSSPSTEVSAALTDPGQITLNWTNATGSDRVTIWRGTTAGGETQFVANVTGTSWTDTGAITWQTYSPGPPTARKWQVKNLFEIKAARRVTFTGNVLETAWKGSDIGFTGAWIKSVNQDNQCWSCGSRDILIEHNVFRHIYGFLELHGTESAAGQVKPPPLTNVIVRNNLVYDSSSVRWGEGADQYAIYVGDYVVNWTLEHNTIDHNDRGSKGFLILDGVQGSNTGAVIRGNIFRRNTYGVHSDVGTGSAGLAVYAPGYVWSTNVMEGANAAQYPATTFTPNDATYEASFVDYEEDGSNAISDWALDSGSSYNNAAWDGTDIGVDIPALLEALAVVEDPPTSDLVIVTATLPNGAMTAAYAQALTVTGGDPNVGTTATISANSGATYTGVAETQIKQVAATTNYGSNVNCSVERWTSTDKTHCLIKASGLSSIPSNAVVTGARLRMYLNGAGQSGLSTNINVRRLLRNVNHAQATWNIYSTGNSWGTSGGLGTADRESTLSASASVSETLGYVTFTDTQLTSDVQGMVNGTITNYGWILERDDSLADYQWRTFTSSEGTNGQRPVLEVDYVVGGAYAFSVTSGSLPTGLSLDATTGAISGTPSVAGTYNFTIEVEDDASATDDQAFQVIVRSAASITTTTVPNGAINAPYSQSLAVTGDEAPYTWTIESGAPPSGVTLSAAGVLSGIPAEIVAASLTVRVTGALGSTDTQALSLTIIDGPTVSTGNLTLTGDRLRLNYGSCTMRSGAGSPEGVLSGRPCDMYIDTSAGVWYTKWSGSATTTGWGVGHNAAARVNGNLDVTGYVGLPGYVSQLSGWRVDNAGAADFRYLYTDELHAKAFIADLEQALAGGQIISKSVSSIAEPFTCPAPGGIAVLTVEDLPGAPNMQVFQSGDSVVVRTFARASGSLTIGDCVGVVTSPSTPGEVQSWTFTRNTSSNGGTMPTSTVVPAGGLALDYGTSGNGFYEVSAVDGAYGLNSPYMQVATWSTAPTSGNFTLRTRCGNLRGITSTGEYGCILGTYSASGSAQYIRASDQAFEIRNINLSMFSGSTEVIKLDRTAPSLAIGSTVPSAYGTGTGIWMGIDAGAAKFRVGNPAGNRLMWDGTTLTVVGDGGGVTNINGANIQTGTVSAAKLTVGNGRNMIRNADCVVSTDDWTHFTTSAAVFSLARALSPWRLNDDPNTCYLTSAGTPASASNTGGYIAEPFPVVAGNRYEASAYLGVHRSGNSFVYIVWQNAAGSQISQSNGNNCTTASNGGMHLGAADANSGTGYCRSGVVATAPSGAVNAIPVVVTTHNGGTNPYLFWVHAYFGEALVNQTELTPWGPAGYTSINGGVIETNTITASKLSVTTLSAITADLGTVTAGTIGISGSNVSLSSSGLVLTSGAGTSNRIRWTDGGYIGSNTGLTAIVNSFVAITNGSASFEVGGTTATVAGTFNINSLAGGGARTLCIDNSGNVSAVAGACP